MSEEKELRIPSEDSDIQFALPAAGATIDASDIKHLIACIAGANSESCN
jgi:hypothetical protein